MSDVWGSEACEAVGNAVLSVRTHGRPVVADMNDVDAIVDAVLEGVTVHAVPRAEYVRALVNWEAEGANATRSEERYAELRQSVLDLAEEFYNAGGTTDGINCARELRALVTEDGAS